MECSCEYCLKRFANKNTLKTHQMNAKYCLKLQGKITTIIAKQKIYDDIEYICGTCSKRSSRKEIHDKHVNWCIDTLHGQMIAKLRIDNEKLRTDSDAMTEKLHSDNSSKEGMIALMQDKIDRQEAKNISMEKSLIDMQDKIDRQEAKIISTEQSLSDMKVLQKEVEIYKNQTEDYANKLYEKNENKDKCTNVLEGKLTAVVDKNVIKMEVDRLLQNKYRKNHSRVVYNEKNVVYILTTNPNPERRYVMGKTTDLTKRMSTYNKSDEHVVVYFQQCLDEETMGIVEKMIFKKLDKYREQANRERFILPVDCDINLFTDTVKQCVLSVSTLLNVN
jgi:hypothetical protein